MALRAVRVSWARCVVGGRLAGMTAEEFFAQEYVQNDMKRVFRLTDPLTEYYGEYKPGQYA